MWIASVSIFFVLSLSALTRESHHERSYATIGLLPFQKDRECFHIPLDQRNKGLDDSDTGNNDDDVKRDNDKQGISCDSVSTSKRAVQRSTSYTTGSLGNKEPEKAPKNPAISAENKRTTKGPPLTQQYDEIEKKGEAFVEGIRIRKIDRPLLDILMEEEVRLYNKSIYRSQIKNRFGRCSWRKIERCSVSTIWSEHSPQRLFPIS